MLNNHKAFQFLTLFTSKQDKNSQDNNFAFSTTPSESGEEVNLKTKVEGRVETLL